MRVFNFVVSAILGASGALVGALLFVTFVMPHMVPGVPLRTLQETYPARLTVKAPYVTKFTDLTEPYDIQPALGYEALTWEAE